MSASLRMRDSAMRHVFPVQSNTAEQIDQKRIYIEIIHFIRHFTVVLSEK